MLQDRKDEATRNLVVREGKEGALKFKLGGGGEGRGLGCKISVQGEGIAF